MNDIWAREIYLTNFEMLNSKEYKVRYKVILWDHFGLDLPDMEKLFNVLPASKEIFASWFILQHLYGYKPFITKIPFEKEFICNIDTTIDAKRAMEKSEKNMNKQENKIKEGQQRFDPGNLEKINKL